MMLGSDTPSSFLAITSLLAVFFTGECVYGSPPPERPPDVLLLTVDTLRSDRLGLYGAKSGASEPLDRLFAGAVVFENAFTVAPLTLPSFATLHTGRYPWHHGIHDNGRVALAGDSVTLAEEFRGAGYRTLACVGAYPVARRFGLDKGFDQYDDEFEAGRGRALEFAERSASKVVDRALRMIQSEQPGTPLFVWLHLFDPHAPYSPPEPFASRYRGRPYDGEIAHASEQLERFVQGFEFAREGRRPWLVFAADHGEALGDHGEKSHGLLAFGPTLKIPLALRVPGLGGARIRWPISNADIYPTLLGLLGRRPKAKQDGLDTSPFLRRGSSPPPRPIRFESRYGELNFGTHPLLGVIAWPIKLVVDPHPLLFDLEKDPREIADLTHDRRDTIRRLRRLLPPLETEAHSLDAESRRKLRALGYASGSATTSPGKRLSVRELLPLLSELEKARSSLAAGQFPRALEIYARLAERLPDSSTFGAEYGTALAMASQYSEAARWLEMALGRDPSNIEARLDLANVESLTGKTASAQRHLERILRMDPDSAEAHFQLGALEYSVGGDRKRVRRHWERFLELEPGDDRAAGVRRLLNSDSGAPGPTGAAPPRRP